MKYLSDFVSVLNHPKKISLYINVPQVFGFGEQGVEEMTMINAAVAPKSNCVVESRVIGIERRQKPRASWMRSIYVSCQLLEGLPCNLTFLKLNLETQHTGQGNQQ